MTSTSRRRFLGALAAGAAVTSAPVTAAPVSAAARGGVREAARPLYLGTFGSGVAVAGYDPASGQITAGTTIAGVVNPSFLALHPSGNFLYTVNEQSNGSVTAIALSDGGGPVLGAQSTGGDGPTHLSVHPSGSWLLSANYGSGSVAVHPIAADGSLGARTDLVKHDTPPPGPQGAPHAHQILTSPDGRHVLAVDLGTDAVYTYTLDTSAGRLTRVSYASFASGAGPRHMVFHPSGTFAYVACELGNAVVVCTYDPATGKLTPGQPQSTGSAGGSNSPAEIVTTSDGAFVYLSNRGDESIARYAVGAQGAELRLLGTTPVGGSWPRHLALSPDDGLLFASNQYSGTVTVFHVDTATGGLTSAGSPYAHPSAVCALPW
jgi:6-phosphogluconolactonase (cycloisomerase 2 family)